MNNGIKVKPEDIFGGGYSEIWTVNGRYLSSNHRIDGPAIIWKNGSISWWINGLPCVSTKHYQEKTGLSNEDLNILILKYGPIGWPYS